LPRRVPVESPRASTPKEHWAVMVLAPPIHETV
jgi:hypothetical protein